LPLDGMFILSGAAPPSSKKLTAEGTLFTLVDFNAPEKYGRRLMAVPLYVPGLRIPLTAMPTLGVV